MSGKSELRIFDDYPPQVVAQSAIFQDIYPSTALDNSTTAIEFLIQGSQNDYLDLNDTLLSLKLKVLNGDGSSIKATDTLKPIPSNYFLNTLFSDVLLQLNDVAVEGGEAIYPYKSTIESALNFTDDTKRLQLLPAGYSEDDDERVKWCDESKEFEIVGSLRLDFLSQPKYLIPGVSARIRLIPSNPKFCLHFPESTVATSVPNKEYKVNFTSAILYVRRVKVNPSVEQGHRIGLRTKNAIYPYTRTKTISYSIPKGATSYSKENLFSSGLLPKLIVVGMVAGDSYNGSLFHRPVHFENFDVNYVALYRDGQSLPYKRAYTPNFSTGMITETYVRSILQNMQLLNTNNNNGITMADFKTQGYTLFTFNLTPDFDVTQPQVVQDCNLRLELRFRKPLNKPINVIAYATYDAHIQITKDGAVKTDTYA